jgi:light-regulated signal transduction histidine kinase (bacteriophytochrome)
LPLTRAARDGEVVKDVELILRMADGQEAVILCNAGPIKNAKGQVTGGVVAWRNITERKRMEDDLRASRNELEQRVRERTAELERTNQVLMAEIHMREQAEKNLAVQAVKLEKSNREMQDFVFIASHDLQEPLRKLQTLADVLTIRCRDSLSDEGVDYIDRIRKSAKRMQELLLSLLSYSRLSTKAGPFETVSLSEAANEALADLEILTGETGGFVEIGDLPLVEADVTQMVHLFQNLIQNGLRFYREGVRPRVRIYSQYVRNERFRSGAYEIFVEDNGIGFDEKYLDRIFLPFERLHARDAYGGVGMGLTICKKIVERHNGLITARSTPGKGAIFIVTIPAEQKENDGSLH